MNIWMIIAFTQPVTWQTIAAVYISSFWFDLTHGFSTLIFLLVLAKPWIKKINRIKIKYGLME
jgi:energy-coupling factor transport system substrate-specific component